MSEAYASLSRPEPGKLAKAIRIINYVVGIVIVGLGVLGMFTLLPKLVGLQFFMVLTPVFMILLGLMQIGVEFKIKFVVENFTFMGSLLGKGFFMLFLSSVMYCMMTVSGWNSVETFLVCLPLLVIGIMYSCLQCCWCNKGYSKEVKENLV